jgi:hypothetical protein
VPAKGDGVRDGRSIEVAWLAWLGLVLPSQAAFGADFGDGTMDARHEAAAAHAARVRISPNAEEVKRPVLTAADTAPPVPHAEVPPQRSPVPAWPAEHDLPAAEDARPAPPQAETAPPTTFRDRFGKRHIRRRQRTGADPRLADLAATRGKVAAVAHLHGAAPIRPAGPTVAAVERRIRAQEPDRPSEPARPALPAVAAATTTTTLDESIVKEITQRKVLFRMCYESARRRGVTATRADVKWILAADGGVHDIEVAVAQDAQLASCIRVIASRPFPAGVGQDMPVAIPLLFVSAR